MLLLVSGASGVGKSTARLHARTLLDETFEDAELCTLGPIPSTPTGEWRHQQTEAAVLRAIELEQEGRHLLFAGDPVPVGEVLAAPSADRIDVAACLLDADEQTQSARLDARQDPPELRHRHHAYAAWLRAHATDPGHMPEVITTDGWSEMRWDRWIRRGPGPQWAITVIDTSNLDAPAVGAAVADWCRAAVAGDAPVFRAGWHLAEFGSRPRPE